MLSRRIAVPALLFSLSTGTALWAHPGHGATNSSSISHYVLEPSHGWWLLLAVALAGISLASRYATKSKNAQSRVRK